MVGEGCEGKKRQRWIVPSTNSVTISACRTLRTTVAAVVEQQFVKSSRQVLFGILNELLLMSCSLTAHMYADVERFSYFHMSLLCVWLKCMLLFFFFSQFDIFCVVLEPRATTMPQIWTNIGSCSTQAPWDRSTWSSLTSCTGKGCKLWCQLTTLSRK